MLYGVRRDLRKKLVNEGWRCRVYIPFGTEWYPYFMRRPAERPANAIFILKNMFRSEQSCNQNLPWRHGGTEKNPCKYLFKTREKRPLKGASAGRDSSLRSE